VCNAKKKANNAFLLCSISHNTQLSKAKYSTTLLRSLSGDQRIRDSLSRKTYSEGSLLKAIGFQDFKNQTSYRRKLLMRGLLIRVLLYYQSASNSCQHYYLLILLLEL
jgi:hypothetical protein